jgi:hypothetical protein
MTLALIFAAATIWGVVQWPSEVCRSMRMIAAASALLVFIVLLQFGGRHVDRFASYGWHWGKAGREKLESKGHAAGEEEIKGTAELIVLKSEAVLTALSRTCRGRMYGGAIRAWKTSPWTGIGPGMHQNLWPQFAATNDGDRERGIWPTLTNNNFHSYEVHSDWLQLLEEYGITGVILFIFPMGILIFFILSGIHAVSVQSRKREYDIKEDMQFVYLLSALLALVTMGFHSLGDFNLQMPATVWILSAVISMPFRYGEQK